MSESEKWSRRDFLKASAAAVAAVSLPSVSAPVEGLTLEKLRQVVAVLKANPLEDYCYVIHQDVYSQVANVARRKLKDKRMTEYRPYVGRSGKGIAGANPWPRLLKAQWLR